MYHVYNHQYSTTHWHLNLTVKDHTCLCEHMPQEYITSILRDIHILLKFSHPVPLLYISDVKGIADTFRNKRTPSALHYFDMYCKKLLCLPGIRQEHFINHCLRIWESPYNCVESQTHCIWELF